MNGGVIIIGSLYWDDHLKENDNIRKNWRDNNLDFKEAIRVKLPIRYGRKSNKGEYTMVFSTMLEKSNNLGIGYIIPFKKNPIDKFEIEKEALEIAKSEGIGTIENPKFFASWGGALGILFKNPNTIPNNQILKKWKKKFDIDKRDNDDFNFCIKGERKSIKNGKLQINWPICVDNRDQSKLDELDFLIGASNKPRYYKDDTMEIFKYPTIEEIASANINDKIRYYFQQNVKYGILTFQDLRILNKMKSKK